jgi:hypothetical protein
MGFLCIGWKTRTTKANNGMITVKNAAGHGRGNDFPLNNEDVFEPKIL